MPRSITLLFFVAMHLPGCLHKSILNSRPSPEKRQALAALAIAKEFVDAAETPSDLAGVGNRIHSKEVEFFTLLGRINRGCRLEYSINLQRVINFKKLYSYTIDTRVKLKHQSEENKTSLGLQVVNLVLPQDFKHADRFAFGRYYHVTLKHYKQLSGFISKVLMTSPGCALAAKNPAKK